MLLEADRPGLIDGRNEFLVYTLAKSNCNCFENDEGYLLDNESSFLCTLFCCVMMLDVVRNCKSFSEKTKSRSSYHVDIFREDVTTIKQISLDCMAKPVQ